MTTLEELNRDCPECAVGVRCGECRGTGEVCTGTIDGTPELFDCDRCGGTGNSLAQQPAAAGEEIMVNTPYDVFTLPLRPSGLSSGPRFVVHVPGPEQPAAVDGALRAEVERVTCELMDATTRADKLAEALRIAEAALADIGDADREPGDDVAWCERRAAQALPMVRALLRDLGRRTSND